MRGEKAERRDQPSVWWYVIVFVLAAVAAAVWSPHFFGGTTRAALPPNTAMAPPATSVSQSLCYRMVSFTDQGTGQGAVIEVVARGERSKAACTGVEASDLHQFGQYLVHVTRAHRVEDGMTLAGTTIIGGAPVEVYDDGTPQSVTAAGSYIQGTQRSSSGQLTSQT